MSEESQPVKADHAGAPTRRRMLQLGAISASAVITIRPALAQSAASVLNCEIPVPDPARSGHWIAADGTLVDPATPGAFAPPPRPLRGEEVRSVMAGGGSYSGTDPQASQAYTNYIRRLQQGTSGFTCYASLQMPRG